MAKALEVISVECTGVSYMSPLDLISSAMTPECSPACTGTRFRLTDMSNAAHLRICLPSRWFIRISRGFKAGQTLGVQRGGKRFGVREAGVSDKEAQDLSLGNCKVVLCGVLLQTLVSVWCG